MFIFFILSHKEDYLIRVYIGNSVEKRVALEMSVLAKDLVFLIIQFLNEEGYKVTARM